MLAFPIFAVSRGQIGGTESAIYNLVRGLKAIDAPFELAYSDPKNLSSEFLQWIKNNRVAHSIVCNIPGPRSKRFLQEALFECGRPNGDVLYPNYFLPPRLNQFQSGKTGVLLHDIQYKSLPEFHSRRRRAWLDAYLPQMFKWADRVFLISKSELALVDRHFGSKAADRCEVIYNAIDWSRFDCDDSENSTFSTPKQRYILSVFHPFPHKNFSTLLRSFNIIAESYDDMELYIVGKNSVSNENLIRTNVDPRFADRVHLTGFLKDSHLGALYKGASAFVLPSLYEGFGMPAVEALGLGIRTVVSGLPSLIEVTRGHARYVMEVKNAAAWSEAIIGAIVGGGVSSSSQDEIKAAYSPPKIARSLMQHFS